MHKTSTASPSRVCVNAGMNELAFMISVKSSDSSFDQAVLGVRVASFEALQRYSEKIDGKNRNPEAISKDYSKLGWWICSHGGDFSYHLGVDGMIYLTPITPYAQINYKQISISNEKLEEMSQQDPASIEKLRDGLKRLFK